MGVRAKFIENCLHSAIAGGTVTELDFAIDERRLSRVAAAAEVLAADHARPEDAIRIDVILLAPGQLPRHIENAWIG